MERSYARTLDRAGHRAVFKFCACAVVLHNDAGPLAGLGLRQAAFALSNNLDGRVYGLLDDEPAFLGDPSSKSNFVCSVRNEIRDPRPTDARVGSYPAMSRIESGFVLIDDLVGFKSPTIVPFVTAAVEHELIASLAVGLRTLMSAHAPDVHQSERSRSCSAMRESVTAMSKLWSELQLCKPPLRHAAAMAALNSGYLEALTAVHFHIVDLPRGRSASVTLLDTLTMQTWPCTILSRT